MCAFVAGPATSQEQGIPRLFDSDDVLDVEIRGPLWSLVQGKRDREEYPVVISAGGQDLEIKARARGNSRLRLCRFPPLRLDFTGAATVGTVFEGLDRLRMVTHCNRSEGRSEDAALNEFAAYRLFNALTENSYRVRLLRVNYGDSDERLRSLDKPYYGFVTEPDSRLGERLTSRYLDVTGVVYKRLDQAQVALMTVFQYMIGNPDWSLVTGDGEDECCHNVRLFDAGDSWLTIPYDFDLSGLANARYRSSANVVQSRRRVYLGLCEAAREDVARAVRHVVERKDALMRIAGEIPSVNEKARSRRVKWRFCPTRWGNSNSLAS